MRVGIQGQPYLGMVYKVLNNLQVKPSFIWPHIPLDAPLLYLLLLLERLTGDSRGLREALLILQDR